LTVPEPDHEARRFIVTFYLNDDTVMVYEPTQRNSGIISGKFLEKMKYKNVRNELKFFEPADFIVGNEVEINAFKFTILGCDERTRQWYRDNFSVELKENTD